MRTGSLFAGIGGLDLAVEAVLGAEPAWFVEYETAPSAVLERHWPGVPNLGDVTAVDWTAVAPVDVLTAGYPCQPFSHAGQRKGTADVRHLWPYALDAVRHLRPGRVVLENVAAHLSLGFGRVVADLAGMGYVGRWGVVRASDAGLPHRRARIFVVATDAGRVADVRVDGSRRVRDAAGPVEGGAQQRERARHPARHGDPAPTDAGRSRRDGRAPVEERRPQERATAPRCGEDDRLVATDADGAGFGRGAQQHGEPPTGLDGAHRRHADRPRMDTPRRDAPATWGPYTAAVERWERLSGQPAPHPLDETRLNPDFVRWMMGFPPGWVDGMKRNQALKALGNAVAPPQGILALSLLLGVPADGTTASGQLLPTQRASDTNGAGVHGDGGLDLRTAVQAFR